MSKVIITRQTGGYDISAYQNGTKVNSNWRHTFQLAYSLARTFAEYYTDDNGQSLTIEYPSDIVITGA